MGLCACGCRRKKKLEAVLGFDLGEVGSMCAQVAEQRLIVVGNTLANDCDAKSLRRQRLRLDGCLQALTIIGRGFAKRIELVRTPEVSGLLFNELRGRIDPIEAFELRRDCDVPETAETILWLATERAPR